MAKNVQYKCPKCGGPLEFDSKTQKLVCPFCDSTYDIAEFEKLDEQLQAQEANTGDEGGKAEEEKPAEASFSGEWSTDAGTGWGEGEQESMKVYRCPSCSGEIIGDANTAAATCPYCGNQTVMAGQLSGTLKPDMIIPFKKDKNAAVAAFEQNIQGKKLVPKIFKDRHHIDEIKGIYVPFWLFDAQAQADIDYECTTSVMWHDEDNDYIETSFFEENRHRDISFDNLPADGSKKMPDDLMESIEPFDYKDAVDFSAAYLAGYFADKYDVTAEESVGRISERAKNSAISAFQSTVNGYESIRASRIHIDIKESKAKYALLPVWMLNTNWDGQTYTFAMNGQTGKFIGNLPVDQSLSRKYFWSIAGIIAVIVFIISSFIL